MQPSRLHSKWLQEIGAMQCRQLRRLACDGTRHLKVGSGREDNTSLNNVVGHEAVECTSSRRAEDIGAI